MELIQLWNRNKNLCYHWKWFILDLLLVSIFHTIILINKWGKKSSINMQARGFLACVYLIPKDIKLLPIDHSSNIPLDQKWKDQILNVRMLLHTCFDCINGDKQAETARWTASEGVFKTSNNLSTTAWTLGSSCSKRNENSNRF